MAELRPQVWPVHEGKWSWWVLKKLHPNAKNDERFKTTHKRRERVSQGIPHGDLITTQEGQWEIAHFGTEPTEEAAEAALAAAMAAEEALSRARLPQDTKRQRKVKNASD